MNEVLEAIENTVLMANGSADMERHLQGFVRLGRGSYVEGLNDLETTLSFLRNMSADFAEVPHKEVNAECPGAARSPARYFRAVLPQQYTARESVVLMSDLTAAGRLGAVRVREGAHGLEFYIPEAEECDNVFGEKPTQNVWIILGPSEAGEVVWTWYPGRMTAGTQLDNHAVKINA